MRNHLRKDESGMALLTVLLVVLLASALMAGMFAAVVSDQRSQGIDRDQSQAYAGAHAGLEKLTTDLAQLFTTDFSPSAAQLTTASATPPSIYGFNFVAPGGGPGYSVTFNPDPCSCPNAGNPVPSPSNDITTGPFAGFKGLITPYTLTVTARSTGGGSEVRLRREVQTVAVPVFQFGIFGEKSLSYFAGTAFTFGGRVHTNENLFLAHGTTGGALTLDDKLTAVNQVVRAQLENGSTLAAAGAAGTVLVPTVVGVSNRALAASEGSVTAGPSSAAWAGWKNLSEVTYNANIRTTLTGAKRLDLPLVSQGARPIDLIRRPGLGSNEDTTNRPVFGQRFYAQASLRILLSDRVADFTTLPTITATAPVALDGTTYNPAGLAPVARSIGPNSATFSTTTGTGSSSTGNLTMSGAAATWDWLRVPQALRPGGLGIVIAPGVISNCTAVVNATDLTCDVSVGTIPYNTTFNVTRDASVGGETIQLTTGSTGTMTVGAARTIKLVATRELIVGARVIWSGNTPLTCSGYSATQITNCYWTGTAPSGSVTTHALSQVGQSLLGGFIKVEKQNAAGAWSDVTTEILNLGFSAPNQEGAIGRCVDPTPNAVLRLQRLRDNGSSPTTTVAAACPPAPSLMATDYWPNNLYDAREGAYRDVATSTAMTASGVMGFVTLDVANLKRWFSGAIGTTGTQALNNNGYIVYFSDRRGDHNESDPMVPDTETGEYGSEDGIDRLENPWTAPANAVLDDDGNGNKGEDVNENGTLEVYGQTPHALALPTGAAAPFDSNTRPWTSISSQPQARVNRPVLFRRALKLWNGGIAGGVNNLPATGLTVAAENPVYVHGNYNAESANVSAEPNVPAAIIADAVTVLSNAWQDVTSIKAPNDRSLRVGVTTGYRFAMVAGRSRPFAIPGWGAQALWGTDGGVHNFMRMLEAWNVVAGTTTWYRGSMVSLYYSRQLVGTFRLNNNIFWQGVRQFDFDDDFLQPTLLPPGTPMFRDVNTLRFRQILRPNQ